MKKYLFFCFTLIKLFASYKKEQVHVKKPNSFLDSVTRQYAHLYHNAFPLKDSDTPMPRTVVDGKLYTGGVCNWTKGFHPSLMWNLYSLNEAEVWKPRAITCTVLLDTTQYFEAIHDLSYMIGTCFGTSLKYLDSHSYEIVMVQAATVLTTRFKPKAVSLTA